MSELQKQVDSYVASLMTAEQQPAQNLITQISVQAKEEGKEVHLLTRKGTLKPMLEVFSPELAPQRDYEKITVTGFEDFANFFTRVGESLGWAVEVAEPGIEGKIIYTLGAVTFKPPTEGKDVEISISPMPKDIVEKQSFQALIAVNQSYTVLL